MYARRDPRAVDDRRAAVCRDARTSRRCATRASGPFGPVDDGLVPDRCTGSTRASSTTQQAWVSEQMKLLADGGPHVRPSLGADRDSYDYLGSWRRDPDGVPPFQALDRRYAECGVGGGRTHRRRAGRRALASGWPTTSCRRPSRRRRSRSAPMFTPRPKEPWWPAAAPEVPGVGERVFVTFFLEDRRARGWRRSVRRLSATSCGATGSLSAHCWSRRSSRRSPVPTPTPINSGIDNSGSPTLGGTNGMRGLG